MSLQEVGDWLQDKKGNQTVVFYIEGEEFAGYIIITSIDLINGHAIFGINILRSFQGKGLVKSRHLKFIISVKKNYL